ncbi:MAG: TolB family protein [Bacillota bacterium]
MYRQTQFVSLFAIACGVANPAIADAPTATPQLFAPGTLSGTASEDCLSFTPDGDTAVYDLGNGKNAFIVISHRVNGVWSKPEIAPFSGQWLDHDPAISPDGHFLVYASNRPATPGGTPVAGAGNLWRVERKGDGWGEPVRLPDTVNGSPRTYAPSIAADGSLYYIRPNAAGILHIFRSQYRNGSYERGVEQAVGDPAAHEKDPAIAPDESFVVFDSDDPVKKDPDRFFIAFREGDHWGKAVDLGDAVNANNNPWGPHLGPDGRTLYYTSDRTVPVAFPRTPDAQAADFARLLSWDNGENNIWSISLTPWIHAHGAKQK